MCEKTRRSKRVVISVIFVTMLYVADMQGSEVAESSSPGAHPTLAVAADSDEKVLRERLSKEGFPAWAKYHELLRTSAGSYSSYQSHEPGKLRSPIECEYALNQELMKVRESGRRFSRVFAANDEYVFGIGKRADMPGGRYAIEWLETRPSDLNSDERIKDVVDEFIQVLFSATHAYGKPYSEWFELPECNIKRVSQAGSGGDDWIRVDYEFIPTDPKSKLKQASAFVVFDAAHYWVMREYRARLWWGVHGAVLKYEMLPDGFPRMTEKTEVFLDENEQAAVPNNHRTLVFHDLRLEPTPASEFRLPHFGLPEPILHQAAPRHIVLICFNVGLACLAIAFLIRRISRRRHPPELVTDRHLPLQNAHD